MKINYYFLVTGLFVSSLLQAQNQTFSGSVTATKFIAGSELVSGSSAVAQFNGLIRTGTVYIHDQTNNVNSPLKNVSGVLRWGAEDVFTSGNAPTLDQVLAAGSLANTGITANNFITNAANTEYSLFYRNQTAAALYVQSSQDKIASFRFGSSGPNTGTEALGISETQVLVGNQLEVSGEVNATAYKINNQPLSTAFSGESFSARNFRTTASNADYSLLYRTGVNPALYVQSENGMVASFQYGSSQANAGTEILGISDQEVKVSNKLVVDGIVESSKVKVSQTPGSWPDYVFNPSYNLMKLSDLETYIKTNSHLPNIPSEDQIQKEGQDVGSIQTKLLEKIEELTLYIIEQEKRQKQLEERVKELEKSNQ